MDSTATSRMAAMGAIDAARRAGRIADSRVMIVPVKIEEEIAVIGTTIGVSGAEKPIDSMSALRPMASSTPSPTPMAEASRPTTNASSITEVRT